MTEVVVAGGTARTVFGTYRQLAADQAWNEPSRDDVRSSRVVCLDPLFADASQQVADWCVEAGIPYVTVDVAPDTEMARHAEAQMDDNRSAIEAITVPPVTLVEPTDTNGARPSGSRSALRLLTMLSGRGDDAAAIVNGLFGDTLADRGSRVATPMTIRAGNTVLPLDRHAPRGALVDAVPNASPRICLLVHGLMSTESIWRYPKDASTTYGRLLADEHDMTVLSVRYNTGRHISANGSELARLLSWLMRSWPVPVREINLIGHSMGGLVVRSACHYGRHVWPVGRRLPIGRPWTSRVRRVVLIGVPNTGAGLEGFVNAVSAALWSLPVAPTRLLGLGLDRRSAGIKDLRFGAIHHDDWLEHDPGALRRPHPHRPHRLRRADHLVIAGSITADPEHPVARLIGDALVTSTSAAGRSDDGDLFPGASTCTFPKLTHNTLAHHPDVYEAIADWW